MSKNTLRITEIFQSIQGESTYVGLPTTFVRLTGCPLRCTYCDTAYAFKGGTVMQIDEIMTHVSENYAQNVCVTGGEPLAQPDCLQLLTKLCDKGYRVSLETSGALSVANVDQRVAKILDLKTPKSNESHRNLYANIDYLTKHDQVKFVICDRGDFEFAKETIKKYRLTEICEVLFSPSYEELEPKTLAEWILNDCLRVRYQVQLHKVLWGEENGR